MNLVEILNRIASEYNFPVIVSCHPRTRKMIDAKGVKFHKNVRLMTPMSLSDYNHLQLNSNAVLSDSGTIREQFSILNFSQEHERPEASIMMVGLDPDRVM